MLLLVLLLLWPATALYAAATPSGAELYQNYCARCHDSAAPRIPPRQSLQLESRTQILRALESGPMQAQGQERTPEERAAIASYLANPAADAAEQLPASAACPSPHPAVNLGASQWNGWGRSLSNDRFQDARGAGLTLREVPQLRLRWAFAIPDGRAAPVQPTIVGRYVFIGSASGRLYALDLEAGCVYWTFDAAQAIRTAVSVAPIRDGGKAAAFFTDRSANVYSVDAATGQLRWKRHIGHGSGRSTGTPKLYAGRLYVPLTGSEEGVASESRPCCTTHGSIVALEADSGRILWEASTLREEPHPTHKNALGTQLYGPSGAGVWSTPTIDARLHRLYVATGDSYSDPAGPTSDAILAFDLDTGALLWAHQTTAQDAFTIGCNRKDRAGCPAENGPDFDFGQPPILVTLPSGQRLLVVGQKSGVVHALDPDANGREIWHTRVGHGGVLGGIEWGSAVDGSNIYVAVSDVLDLADNSRHSPDAGALAALRLSDGKLLWRTHVSGCAEHEGSLQLARGYDPAPPPPFGCSPAQSAPVTAIPGVVFSGSEDGHFRAYAAASGQVLWDFDTARAFVTIDYVEGRGGSIDGGGPAIADGIVLTPSGYDKWGEMRGNVLLAFAAESRASARYNAIRSGHDIDQASYGAQRGHANAH